MMVLRFFAGVACFAALLSHAADTRVGFKNIYLEDEYAAISKNTILRCEVVKNTLPLPSVSANAELNKLEQEVLERKALWFGDKICVFKKYNTIAGLEIFDSTLNFYGERLKSIRVSVRLKNQSNGVTKEEDAKLLYATLIEGLTEKYGMPENKDFTKKQSYSETKVSRLLWTLEKSYVYVDQDEDASSIDIFFRSKDLSREHSIRMGMSEKAEERRDRFLDELKKADVKKRKRDF